MRVVKYTPPAPKPVPETRYISVWVIIRTTTTIDPVTKVEIDNDTILRVCPTETNANEYVRFLSSNKLMGKNVTFKCVPAPYGEFNVKKNVDMR